MIVVFVPCILSLQFAIKDRLIKEQIETLKKIDAAWSKYLNIRLEVAKHSIQRYSALVSSIPVSINNEFLLAFDTIMQENEDGAWRLKRQLFKPSTNNQG